MILNSFLLLSNLELSIFLYLTTFSPILKVISPRDVLDFIFSRDIMIQYDGQCNIYINTFRKDIFFAGSMTNFDVEGEIVVRPNTLSYVSLKVSKNKSKKMFLCSYILLKFFL
jgi:hypothetical protein